MPISLLRADNNLPPWRPGLSEVNPFFFGTNSKNLLFPGLNSYNWFSILLSDCIVINS